MPHSFTVRMPVLTGRPLALGPPSSGLSWLSAPTLLRRAPPRRAGRPTSVEASERAMECGCPASDDRRSQLNVSVRPSTRFV